MGNAFIDLLKRGCADLRLSPHQLTLLQALICLASDQGSWPDIRVSRAKLMRLGHIQSTSTFHKCISQLVLFAYIDYKPSYHPEGKTLVRILPGID